MATQPLGFRAWFKNDGSQFVTEVRFEVQSHPESALSRGCGNTGQRILIGDSHQNDEVALNHPAGRNEPVLAGEFEGRMSCLSGGKSYRDVCSRDDVQTVEFFVVLNLGHESCICSNPPPLA